MANDDSLKRQYGEWLALSKADRARLGMPTSQAKWAEAYDVDPKTTTRWKQDPVVVATVNRARARDGGPGPSSDPADVPGDPGEGLDTLEQNLLAKALHGDEKAIEQYLKWFGKDELEARRRSQTERITQMSDDELKAEILEMLGRESVQAWLEGQRAAV